MKCAAILVVCTTLVVVLALPATASVYGDDYPIQINGCQDWTNPKGLPFRCNLRQSPIGKFKDPWGAYSRDCTSFVAWRLSTKNGFEMPFDARAQNWGVLAELLGYDVDGKPAVGAVAWDLNGHVAWVAEVYGDIVTLEEYSAYVGGKPDGRYRLRTNVSADKYRYIHFHDIPRGSNAALQDAGILYTRDHQ